MGDVDVAEALGSDIDMILIGHDHFMRIKLVNGTPVLNSGSHFQRMTTTNITWDPETPTTTLLLESHTNSQEIDYKEGTDARSELPREDLTYWVRKPVRN